MKPQINTMIGRPVLIDWPTRWKTDSGWSAQSSAEERAKAEKNERYFGRTGEILAYRPDDDRGNDLVVKLDDGEIVHLWHGAVTITGPAVDSNDAVVKLLQEIRDLLRAKVG